MDSEMIKWYGVLGLTINSPVMKGCKLPQVSVQRNIYLPVRLATNLTEETRCQSIFRWPLSSCPILRWKVTPLRAIRFKEFTAVNKMIAARDEVSKKANSHQALGTDKSSLTINLPSICVWMSPQKTLHIKMKAPALSALKDTKMVLPG